MAQIVTITNPLTGQPAQVDQLDHTAQQIDDGIGFESTDYPGCYYRTVDGVTEWVNPPMLLGAEYRTTERRNGAPVYWKYANLGKLTNGSFGDISVDSLDVVVGYEAMFVNRPLPVINNSSLTDAGTQYVNVFAYSATIIRVNYYGGANVSGNGDVYVLVKYTKNA